MSKIGKRYILLAVFILICAYMAYSIYNGVTQSTVDQVDSQQMIHATQAARNIEGFFDRYNYSLCYLAQDEHIVDMDEAGRQTMEMFYRSNALEIQGITRVNSSGQIVYTVPYNESVIGSDIGDQSHVREILQTHEPITSDVFTTVQGTRSIAYHVPVYRDRQFDGTLAVLIPFDNLTRENLDDILQIMDSGTAWVTSQNGTILYSQNSTVIGLKAHEAFGSSTALDEMLAGMHRGETGRAVYDITYDNGSSTRMQAIYMPIRLPDRYWSIAISTPESDIMSIMEGFRNNMIIIFVTMVLGTLIFFYYSIRAWAIISEEGRRKDAENALRKNEELLRKVLDTLTVGVWIVDSKGVVKSGNPASRKIWGGAREASIEELGKVRGWWADTGKPVAIREWAAARAMRQGETSINEAIDIECLDGTRKTILNSAAPILGDDGKIEGAIIVNHDVTEQRKTQMALLESEHKFRAFAETSASGIMIYQEGKLTYANPAAQRLMNCGETDLFSMGEWDYVHPDYRNAVRQTITGTSSAQAGCEATLTGSDRKVWAHISGRQIMLDGKPATVITIFDITARKMADDQIKASLAEKEVLLKEIHHRVKNNLQIVSSLLNLQSSYIVDDLDRDMFQDSQNRVRSMALIHEKLYQSRDLGRINFHDYLLDLVNSLYRSYNVRPGQIELTIDVGDMYLSIDRGIPCGLITNELVSNCLKHAFPGDRKGTISIKMSQSADCFELVVSDDGIGLPEGFDIEKQGTLGIQLINTLVGQLEGEVKIEAGKGTTFTIRFPS